MAVRHLKGLMALAATLMLALSCLAGLASAQEEYDPSVFTPNGVVYRFQGNFSLLVENTTVSPPLRELREGNFSLVISIFSRDQGGGYHAWSFSIYLENWYYNRPEELPEPLTTVLESLGIQGAAVPPLVAVKWGTRETYFLIDFHKLKRTLQEAQLTGPESAGALASQVLAATGQVNEEVYFTNPFYIPINVGLGTQLVYGVYNKTSGQQYEVYLAINGEAEVEAAGGTYAAWVVRLSAGDLADIMADLGAEEDLVRAVGSTDLEIDIYYDKASGWLLGYESHGHFYNTTVVERDGQPIEASVVSDVDLVLRLVEPGTVNIGGESLIERELGLPRETALALGALVMALAALRAFLRPRR